MKRGIKEMNIILASGSPRRKELLAQAGFDFEVEVSNADENVAEESPTEMVEELAARKAEAVVNLHNKKEDNCLVIGADTIVAFENRILGKPKDSADAVRMVSMLQGSTHQVYTGVALRSAEREAVFCERTDVQFAPISEEELQRYLDEAAFLDKAGAYAIQEEDARFVTRIEGCPSNVVGLPVQRVYAALREFGLSGK